MTPALKHTSYRLSDEARVALETMAADDGTTRTALLERLIREEARRRRLPVAPKDRRKR